MKTTIEVELKPWSVPNFAVSEDIEMGSIPVSALSEDALYTLANQWVHDLYEKAQKQRPPRSAI